MGVWVCWCWCVCVGMGVDGICEWGGERMGISEANNIVDRVSTQSQYHTLSHVPRMCLSMHLNVYTLSGSL